MKQAAIRNGETLEENTGYDARADLECEQRLDRPDLRSVLILPILTEALRFAAVRHAHKRAPVTTETFLDQAQLQELRRVQSERVELEKMKRLGMK